MTTPKALSEELEAISRLLTYDTISHHRKVGGLNGFCELLRSRLATISANLAALATQAARPFSIITWDGQTHDKFTVVYKDDAVAQAAPVMVKGLTYARISEIVQECRDRQRMSGEGDQMLSRWVSEAISKERAALFPAIDDAELLEATEKEVKKLLSDAPALAVPGDVVEPKTAEEFFSQLVIGEFKPCIVINEEISITEAIFEDVPYIADPVFEGAYHYIDKHIAMDDGRLVGMTVWKAAPSKPVADTGVETGYVLVPREPTDAETNAALVAYWSSVERGYGTMSASFTTNHSMKAALRGSREFLALEAASQRNKK